MTVTNMIWCIFGGVLGTFLGAIVSMNVLYIREYRDPCDYYELDAIEVDTPGYAEMEEYEGYDDDFDEWAG